MWLIANHKKTRLHFIRENRPLCFHLFRHDPLTIYVTGKGSEEKCRWCRRILSDKLTTETDEAQKNFVNALREFLGLDPLYQTLRKNRPGKQSLERLDASRLSDRRAREESLRFYRTTPWPFEGYKSKRAHS